jgi:hypothetical protein
MDIEEANEEVEVKDRKERKDNETNDSQIILEDIIKYKSYTNYIYLWCVSLLYIIVSFPLIVLDLYIGFSKEKCLLIQLKIYLIIYGIIQSFIICIEIYLLCYRFGDRLDELEKYKRNKNTFNVSKLFFHLIWNIYGAIIFWCYVKNNCLSFVTNYLNVKLTFNFIYVICESIKFINYSVSGSPS